MKAEKQQLLEDFERVLRFEAFAAEGIEWIAFVLVVFLILIWYAICLAFPFLLNSIPWVFLVIIILGIIVFILLKLSTIYFEIAYYRFHSVHNYREEFLQTQQKNYFSALEKTINYLEYLRNYPNICSEYCLDIQQENSCQFLKLLKKFAKNKPKIWQQFLTLKHLKTATLLTIKRKYGIAPSDLISLQVYIAQKQNWTDSEMQQVLSDPKLEKRWQQFCLEESNLSAQPPPIPQWLINWSITVTNLAGDHHSGCLFPLSLISLFIAFITQDFVAEILPSWLIPIYLLAGLIFIGLSPIMSSPQFFHLRSWIDVITVQFWFCCFLSFPLTVIWILWQLVNTT